MGILDPILDISSLARDQSVLAGASTQMDILAAEGGKLRRRGKVLFSDTFSGVEGEFHHWRDHQGARAPKVPVGLSNYPPGLLLSTAAVPYETGRADSETSTYKNLSRFRDTGVVSFSGFFAHAGSAGASAGSREVAFSSWQLGIDTQTWSTQDGTGATRGFYKLIYSDSSTSNDPAWYISNDAGDTVIIPGSRGVTAGENEVKWNRNYCRLTVDLSANGGLGGYLEAQINHKVFDLTVLGAGRGMQNPQTGSAMASYSGGLNFGISLVRSTRYPNAIQNRLVANHLTATVGDEKAA